MYRRWSLARQLKLNVLRLIRLRAEPEDIAKGFALGIFIGMTPTFGFQMVLAIFLAMLLKENKIAAALGVWITNPVTAPFIYAFEYESGRLLLGMDHVRLPREISLAAVKSLGWEVLLPMSVGGILYGALCAVFSYSIMVQLVPIVKSWRIPRWPRKPKRR